jgi:hypothetical protein
MPFDDGIADGRKLGKAGIQQQTAKLLDDQYLKSTLGEMSRVALEHYVISRLETPPDYGRYPELEDIYPERVDYVRGLAQGAECSLAEAAIYHYVKYRQHIDNWYWSHQLKHEPTHCSGVLLVGPDGVLGAHSMESGPPPRPTDYRFKTPKSYSGLKTKDAAAKTLKVKKPRTGYIENWGVGNEKGVGCVAATSCSVLLDEPIEDTWPVNDVPLLRFAHSADHLAELYRRYTLHNWSRASLIYADTTGDAVVIEKSFRRIGTRKSSDGVLWCTEGHWETPEMSNYIRGKRLEFLERAGRHLGAEDMQYATDCAVRFTHIGWLCHQPWGRGYEHMRRILTDHAPFPRAICRHCGPDTAEYDRTVTMQSNLYDLTHNRMFERKWDPWKKFACEVPEIVTQYPVRP